MFLLLRLATIRSESKQRNNIESGKIKNKNEGGKQNVRNDYFGTAT